MSEGDSFRFSQTVMQIRQFNEEGINFKGNLPLFGENSHVLFEFPLYQIIAHLISEALNLDPVVAARLSTLILFQISAVLLLRINSVFFNKKNSLPLLVLYQFLPFGLLYGHSPLGEFVPVVLIYIATLLEAGATKRRKTLHFAFSIVIVSLAFLSKVTTAIALTPILFLNTVSTRGPAKKFLLFRAISSISIGLFLTSKWNDYADSLKVTNSYTKALASNHPRMVTWNLGTWDQRFDFGTWYQILVTNVAPIALNGFLLIILGIIGLFRSRKANLAILLICVIAPILIFTNLYLAHLYYLCAIYGVIVLLTITLLDEYSINLKAEKAKSILVFFILVGAASSTNGSNSIQTILRHSGPPSEALKIKNLTNPGDTVLYLGCEWSAYLPYYSERDAIMVPSWIEHVRKNDFEKAAAVFLCDSGQGIMEKNLKLLNKDWRSVDGTIYLRAPNNKESP
jgi:hypothetical protein